VRKALKPACASRELGRTGDQGKAVQATAGGQGGLERVAAPARGKGSGGGIPGARTGMKEGRRGRGEGSRREARKPEGGTERVRQTRGKWALRTASAEGSKTSGEAAAGRHGGDTVEEGGG